MQINPIHIGTSESKRRGLIQEISEKTDTFGDTLVFSVVTGSEALGLSTPNSDIDILTVVTPDDSTPQSIIEFARAQIELQKKYRIKPDYDYPTDVISSEQLKNTVNGRCIIDAEGSLVECESIENYEFDYRVWLYELITQNFDLLAGEIEKLEQATREAIRTALLICAIREKISTVGLDDLRRMILLPIGKPLILGERQTEILISQIISSSFSYISRGSIEIDISQVRAEIRKLITLDRQAEYIISWETLRESVKR